MPGITNPAEKYFKDGLWAYVTDQWKKLVATAAGALHVYIVGQAADVEVKQTTPADLTPGVCGWDGSAWHKQPMGWGYSDRLCENLGGTKVGDGTYEQTSTPVPAGEVYVIQVIVLLNDTAGRTNVEFHVYDGAINRPLVYQTTQVAYTPEVWTADLVLKAGDKIRVRNGGCLNNDVIVSFIWGYKMKIAE